jgi:hypothetical protein
MQNPDARQSQKDSSDWLQGYCYQIWRCRNNAFRADGAYGQFIIVIPEKDAVVAITAESPDMQDEINMVWKYLLPAMKDNQLPENAELAGSLKTRLEKLTLDLPSVTAESKISGTLANKSFALEANDKKWQSLAFRFNDSVCIMTVFVDSVEYSFNFGKDKWYLGETSKPGPSLTGPLSGIDKYKTAGSYSWKNESTLELVLRYIESPHHETITCSFNKDLITVTSETGKALARPAVIVKGKIQSN